MEKPIRTLDDIFADPDAETLLAPDKKLVVTRDPEVENFKEIVEWIKNHDGKEPEKTLDLTERKMFSRLKGIRNDPERCQKLEQYDTALHLLKKKKSIADKTGTLKQEKMSFDSLDDILNDDSLLFNDDPDDLKLDKKLFDTKKLQKTGSKKMEEEKSVRETMDDFYKYQSLFKQVQSDISAGRRQLIKFHNPEKNLKEHSFFILNGQLIYIEAIGDQQIREGGDKINRKDARAHVIYDNGTENFPFIRGLSSSLYGSKRRHLMPGYIVSEPIEGEYQMTSDDYVTGYIYVLKSLSTNPYILDIEKKHDLYKVGFTTNSVKARIANAENEPTYLYAPVKLIEEVRVINLNAETLESAIHHALADYRLDIDIKAANGKLIKPREWFVVDINTIEDVIGHIITQLRIREIAKQ